MKELQFEVKDEVAYITVNRSQAMNSFNQLLRKELLMVLEVVKIREDIKVVIITGKGDKAFIAGAEISQMVSGTILAVEDSLAGQNITNLIENLPQPVIAAVNGVALGGGMEIMLACDFCIASENAIFGLPEVKIGLIPGWGGTQRITRTLGKKLAMGFALLGDSVTAAEAYRIGLVNEVVPADQLLDKVAQLAKKLLRNSPFAMTIAKKAVLAGMEIPLPGGLQLEAQLEGICFASEDQKEGTTAFVEKRKPIFIGK